MRNHALLYSYDRLKGVQLLALGLVWASYHVARDVRRTFWLVAASGAASTVLFWISYETPYGTHYLRQSQQQLLGAIIKRTAGDAPAFFNGDVRGSEVFYADRNIVELGTVDHASVADVETFVRRWSREHGFDRGIVYQISPDYPWLTPAQLPRHIRISEVFVDGRPSTVSSEILAEKPGDYHARLPSETLSLAPEALW